MDLQSALERHGLSMPEAPARGGVYEPAKHFGENLVYLSGCGPNIPNGAVYAGKLGRDYTIEEGQRAARLCALNLLAVLQRDLGDLGRIRRIVKMLALVAGTDDFYDHPKVANGASELLVDIFGQEAGQCARSAIGVNALPGNIPVEIELLVEIEP